MKALFYKPRSRFAPLMTLLLALLLIGKVNAADNGNANMTPEEAYQHLVAGNARVIGNVTANADRLPPLSRLQDRFPVATVLYSSDMPTTPDRLTGLTTKDLYMVPLKYGAFSANQLDELEYGVMNLRSPLVLVLTHYPSREMLTFVRQYDALTMIAKAEAARYQASGGKSGAIAQRPVFDQYNLIGPAVARAKAAYPGVKGQELADIVEETVAWQSLEAILMQSSVVQDLLRAGAIDLVAGVVDDSTGIIYWLGSHPLQEEFLKPIPETIARKYANGNTIESDTLPPPVSQTVINNYITEYRTNDYYDRAVTTYYQRPTYYEPCWNLFHQNVWTYRPWYGVGVQPFHPWPHNNPWGPSPSRNAAGGLSLLAGHLNMLIGYNHHFGPPPAPRPDFRPHDPFWGRDIYRHEYGRRPTPGPVPGHGPGPAPVFRPDPIRDLIYRGLGHEIPHADRLDRPGFHPAPGTPGRPGTPPVVHPDRPGTPGRPPVVNPQRPDRPGLNPAVNPQQPNRPGLNPAVNPQRPDRPGQNPAVNPQQPNRPGQNPAVNPQRPDRPNRNPGQTRQEAKPETKETQSDHRPTPANVTRPGVRGSGRPVTTPRTSSMSRNDSSSRPSVTSPVTGNQQIENRSNQIPRSSGSNRGAARPAAKSPVH